MKKSAGRQTFSQYIKNPSGTLTLSSPKTETSVRRVSIPQDAIELLIQAHKKHPENQYMSPSPTTGEMYCPDSVVKLPEKIRRPVPAVAWQRERG